MKFAVLWYLHWRLKYPLVITECLIGCYNYADVVGIKKTTIVEVEIKQNIPEILEDLKKKWRKHQLYLQFNDMEVNSLSTHTRPNKFSFAIPAEKFTRPRNIPEGFPLPYGLIIIHGLYNCETIKRARYLTKDISQFSKIEKVAIERLTSENLSLRERIIKEEDTLFN